MKPDVAVIADLCIDILIKADAAPVYDQVEQLVDDYHLELGGSAAIFASQFTRFGGRVGMYGLVGNDLFGRYLRDRIAALGIPTDYLFASKQFKTSVSLGLIKSDDRAMLTHRGCMQEITLESVRDSGLLATARHLHIAGYFLLESLQPHWPSALAQLKENGMTVSLDTNWSPAGDWDCVREILTCVDVLLPNEAEALHLSGKDTVEDAGEWLSSLAGLAVIKRGARGAMAFDGKAAHPFEVPRALLETLRIVDTTGAGDNFDAGFLFGWLKGAPLGECVRLGMTCATSSLSSIGGIEGQLSRPH